MSGFCEYGRELLAIIKGTVSRLVEPSQFLMNDLRHGISLSVNLRHEESFGHAAA